MKRKMGPAFVWTGSLWALLACSQAWGVELITNGGFETGDFTGWTPTTNADGILITELTPWTVGVAGGGWFAGLPPFDTSPLEGVFDAYNGFDGDANLVYELYQDVAIPAGHTASLSTNHRIVYDSLGIVSSLDRIFEVAIQDTLGATLQTLYSESVTISGAGSTDLGWNNQVFDVSAYSGSTVRVHFREFIPESYTGPANIELDRISLVAIPVPEPTSMVLAVVAGLALLHRKRIAKR